MSIQRYATIKVGTVDAMAKSTTQVTGGYYSLSPLSTVPYVKLVGTGGFEKTFTWGEIIRIPDEGIVTVHNASYHRGEIVLSQGKDQGATVPRTVTVPAQLTPTPAAATPAFNNNPGIQTSLVFALGVLDTGTWLTPFDCRRARQVWFNAPVTVLSAGTSIIIIGVVMERGFNTYIPIYGPFPTAPPASGYASLVDLPGSSDMPPIPCGFNAGRGPSTVPHALFDTVFVQMDNAAGVDFAGNGGAFFTAEY